MPSAATARAVSSAAEFAADRHQVGQVLDVAAGEGVLDHRDGGGTAGRRVDGAAHLAADLLDEGDDLADLGRHGLGASGLQRG